MFSYSLSFSFPLLAFHFRYITDASTLAGDEVFGSLRSEIILSNMVLKKSSYIYKFNKIPDSIKFPICLPA